MTRWRKRSEQIKSGGMHRWEIWESEDRDIYKYVKQEWVPSAPEDESALGEGHWLNVEKSGLYADLELCLKDLEKNSI
ncbi:hypothetical protein ROA7450_04192 [Roseovarius albus]|uniref:Uncharacterized protein n=1 Tax=Roseovarius albus TaxID=1247867 RepID=A0A1X7A9Q8_9RHOB|nr:hypothetical protein [Roseovarius albus]SLN74036.1 hypothetical protein ROA7450_04192 [Roseovarius albus]